MLRVFAVVLTALIVACEAQFELVRTTDDGFEWAMWPKSTIQTICVSSSLQYISVGRADAVTFYRVQMYWDAHGIQLMRYRYPTLYPTWPYLLYGTLNLPHGHTAINSVFTKNHTRVLVASQTVCFDPFDLALIATENFN